MIIPKKVLFVCTGNLCRSPMAEGLFRFETHRRALHHVSCASAGTHPVVGQTPPQEALAVCRKHGFDISMNQGKGLTAKSVNEADIICIMEAFHRDAIAMFFPRAKGKVFFMSHWADGKLAGKEIPDPYGRDQSFFADTLTLLGQCMDGLLKQM